MSTPTSNPHASTPDSGADQTVLDCAAFELMLAEVLDRDQLPPSGLRHLSSCRTCSHVLATFEEIAARVRRLPPALSEPSPNLWPQIAARLRDEGVIHADKETCRASTPSPRLVPRMSKPAVHQ